MIKKTATDARQGARGKRVLIVLCVSMVLGAAFALGATGLFPDPENADVVQPTQSSPETAVSTAQEPTG